MREAFALALALLATAAARAAEPSPEGWWRAETDEAIVRITPCGDALCGTLVASGQLRRNPAQTDLRNHNPAERGRPLKGLALFYGVKGGPKVWSGGSVYNPADGRTYHGSITLTGPDTLRLTGCVWGPLCQSQTWRRAPPPTAD